MQTLRPVSKLERILFPIVITVIIALLLPSAAPLIGCLMLGREAEGVGSEERGEDTDLGGSAQQEALRISRVPPESRVSSPTWAGEARP